MTLARQAIALWRETFFPYQLAWISEPSRFALCVKSRQIGFSHATAGGAVKGALFEARPQIVLSASQDLSDEVLEKARRHATFLARTGYPGADRFTVNNATELAWSNGGRIIALPASPRTARSFTGDVWLDEFAYHLDPKKIRDAAFPIALRGDWRIRVFSTPNGAQGLFHEMVTRRARGWVLHSVTLDQATREGVQIDRDAAYTLAGHDERVIAQWYGCQFIDGDYQYYPSAWLERALDWSGRCPDLTHATIHAGFDVGRRKDLSVLVVIALVGSVAYVLAVHEMKRTAFKLQRKTLAALRGAYQWDSLHVDSTGLGTQLAEELVEAWGESEVTPVQFTAPAKESLVTGAFRWLAANALRFPLDDSGAALADEGKSIHRTITTSGNVSYTAPSIEGSHADRWTALCLALAGAGEPRAHRGVSTSPLVQPQ